MREQNKILREKMKALEKIVKLVAKKRGYKSISGIPYKIVDGFLYSAHLSTTYNVQKRADFIPQLHVFIFLKPLILDITFWKIFGMYEEAIKQPESFHVKGAFTTKVCILESFHQGFFSEEDHEITANKLFDELDLRIQKSGEKVFDLDTFGALIADDPHTELSKLLILIAKKDYMAAEKFINYCVEHKVGDGFYRQGKSIIECAHTFINIDKHN